MWELLNKPYELSVWEDQLVTEGSIKYYKEIKIAVIGSDTMTSNNRTFDNKLRENINGEKELKFSIVYKYYDPEADKIIENPIAGLLVNERKLKLHHNDEWYDFIIKEREENSDENTFSFTATELFVNELAKIGYNVEFSNELGNNQGTIFDLGEEALKNTDWVIDRDGSDKIRQYVQEPLYKGTLKQSIECIDALPPNTSHTIAAGKEVFFFYSTVANKLTKDVHIMLLDDEPNYKYDDNHVAKGPNYRLLTSFSYDNDGCPSIIESNSFSSFYNYQAYRLAYGQMSRYDPVTKKYVDIYKAVYDNDVQEVYHYQENTYTTSDIVTDFIVNGKDFQSYQGETISGWSKSTIGSSDTQTIKLATYPSITYEKIQDAAKIRNLKNYLHLHFNGALAGSRNTFYNYGIRYNRSIIKNFVKGEIYAFRIKAGYSQHNIVSQPAQTTDLRIKIAGYTLDNNGAYVIDNERIYFDSTNVTGIKCNNEETEGRIYNGDYVKTDMWGDNIVTPSTDYYYKSEGSWYKWNAETQQYVPKISSDLDYYLYKMPCLISATEEDLSSRQIGIFIYSIDNNANSKDYWIESLELFKYYEVDGKPILIGNAPKAEVISGDKFYIPKENIQKEEDVEFYNDLESVQDYLAANSVVPVYNSECEKINSIEIDHSNCFNIIQELCEKFECWAHFYVEHNSDGSLVLDENYNPIKKISFHNYVGKDNFTGFKYGINLKNIERTVVSDEIVTKMIVESSDSDYIDSGVLDIRYAKSNPLGESYIYNFDYYIDKQLVDRDEITTDLRNYQKALKQKNEELNQKNTEYNLLKGKLSKIKASKTVYEESIEALKQQVEDAKQDFKEATGLEYDTFMAQTNPNVEVDKISLVKECVGKIVNANTLINTYNGYLTPLEEEYKNLLTREEGVGKYDINITTYVKYDTNTYIMITIKPPLKGIQISFNFLGTPKRTYITDGISSRVTFPGSYLHSCDEIVFSNAPINFKYQHKNATPTSTLTIPTSELKQGENIKLSVVPVGELANYKTGLKEQLEILRQEKDEIESNFFKKYSRFIQEGTWNSTDYVDNELYYLDALQISRTSAKPKIEYKFDVIEISELEDFKNYIFNVGDKTYVEDTDFFGYTIQDGLLTPVREEVVISEVTWDLDDPTENEITVQNYRTQFEDLFQRISAAVQSVEYNTPTYLRAASALDSDGLINSDLLISSLNSLNGFQLSGNGSLVAESDGLVSIDLNNTASRLKIGYGGIKISNDSGLTWTKLIDGDGVNTKSLKSGTIDTSQITLLDGEQPSFRWDNSGISAFAFDNNVYNLNKFIRLDRYGLYGINGIDGIRDFYPTSVNDIKNNADFALTWDGFFIRNSYTDGYVSISSDNDFQVIQKINNTDVEKIKIGALEFDSEGAPTKYGINIKDNSGNTVFTTDDNGNLTIIGTIYANAGEIGGMTVNNDKLTMDTIVLEPGVGIYSTVKDGHNNKLFEISDVNGSAKFRNIESYGGLISDLDVINALTVGHGNTTGLIKSVNYVPLTTGWAILSDGTADFNNVIARGTIYATAGELGDLDVVDTITVGANGAIQSSNFSSNDGWKIDNNGATLNNAYVRGTITADTGDFLGSVYVGDRTTDRHISINGGYNTATESFGALPTIKSGNYSDGASYGWMIDGNGDATFNNVTVRGAIKTAVFEYEEIQAVGGAFLFRPSSTIRTAKIEGNDLIVTVEKPLIFRQGNWCKVSNYNTDIADIDNLSSFGLTYIYKIKQIRTIITTSGDYQELVLENAALSGEILDVFDTDELPGGALIDFGNENPKLNLNYGIGINSSDNYVNLPRRAISLFETEIHPNNSVKVTYDLKGILGTLPNLSSSKASTLYANNMAGTQGIYTDNAYIGNSDQYMAYYTDNDGDKHLRIKAESVVFEILDDQGQGTGEYKNIQDIKDGESAIQVVVDSSAGNMFRNRDIAATLTCTVYEGTKDITNQVTRFTWKKKDKDGNIDSSWSRLAAGRTITITAADVASKAIFICEVEF